ncbi:MAG TPA: hypothetical protein VKX33_00715, partial [Cyclobacteriaceae bacterium]|nr:hypothetical protein [Cyclobacteriaceae bacterium]
MNKGINRRIHQLTGVDLSDRFGEQWDSLSTVGVFVRMSIWLLRGTLKRLFFKSSQGVLMIGKRVTLRQMHYLAVGKSFIAQDHCEINCLSRRGITLGDKVTVGS